MKSNLELFRTESKLTAKQLSLLLNMSVHTYNAIEKGRIPLPFEIGEMLSIIYSVSRDRLISDTVTESDLRGAHKLSSLNESERFSLALYALTGSIDSKCLYRKIDEKKQSIRRHPTDDK